MQVSDRTEALVTRLERELAEFSGVENLSREDLASATVMEDWTFVRDGKKNMLLCGVPAKGAAPDQRITLTGRALHVDPKRAIVVTSCGIYRLGRRQVTDANRRTCATDSSEIEACRTALLAYRKDLETVRRYLSEMMMPSAEAGKETLVDANRLLRALH